MNRKLPTADQIETNVQSQVSINGACLRRLRHFAEGSFCVKLNDELRGVVERACERKVDELIHELCREVSASCKMVSCTKKKMFPYFMSLFSFTVR